MFVCNVETASTFNASKLMTTMPGLQHEVATKYTRTENKEKINQRIVQMLQNKQKVSEETILE